MTRSVPASSMRRNTGIDFGKMINFNQATSVVSYTTPAALQTGTGDYAYVQDLVPRTITALASRLMDQSNNGLLVVITSNGIQVQARHASTNGQIIIPISAIRLNEHNSLVVNWSDTMSYPEVYFNGALITSSPTTKIGARLGAGVTTYLGNRSAVDRGYAGYLDKHAMYSRTLTLAEVAAFHANGTIPASALVAFEMDEVSGNLVDASGNGVTGTPSNVVQNITSLVIPARTAAGTRQAAGTRLSA